MNCKFYFKKKLENKVSIDELFTLINILKMKFDLTISNWTSDISKPAAITFENEIEVLITTVCSGTYLEVKTKSKTDLDKLWNFFEILK